MAAGEITLDEALALTKELDSDMMESDMMESATVSPSKKFRLILTESKEVRANAPI